MLKWFCCLVPPLVALIAIAGCGGGGAELDETSQPVTGVPSLGSLPVPEDTAPRVSSAMGFYELLNYDPVVWSQAGGVDFSGDSLLLDPVAAGGTVWAVYALDGFPTDGSVVPNGASTYNDGTVYLGWSNYAAEQWEFKAVTSMVETTLTQGGDLLSGDGVFYVIIVAESTAVEVQWVTISTDNELPGGPEAVIEVLGTPTVGMTAGFSGAGSSGGDGTLTELTWSFDGADHYTTNDIDEVVTHTFDTMGEHFADLYVVNDELRSNSERMYFDVGETRKELLIIYNSDMAEDLDLVEYYSSAVTGRAIDPDYRLGLPLGEDAAQTISREDYGTDIRDEVLAFIDDPANATIKSNIKYLLMMKGVPYKIPGSNGGDHSLSTNTCVDSELCMLRNGDAYRLEGPVWSGAVYQDFTGTGWWQAGDVEFTPDTYPLADLDGGSWTLNYLVGRITGYTYDNCKQIIDRSLAADTSGTGWIILDTKPGSTVYETMFDPVWPLSGDDWDSGYELLTAAAFNVVGDETSDRITSVYETLPAGCAENILAYCSWGVHSGFENTYILNDLGWTYRPGACFMSYESVNGTTMRCSDPEDPTVGHPGQGQVADFLYMGGTCTIGNVYEPWTDGVGDERWVFDRYVHHGDRWIEAAYKGLYYVSWQEVVVGDPLCRVVAE